MTTSPRSSTPVIASSWSLATALSLLAWYVFAPQCLSTLAVVKRETNSWRYPLIMAGYLFALAYLAAFVTYRVVARMGARLKSPCCSNSSSPSSLPWPRGFQRLEADAGAPAAAHAAGARFLGREPSGSRRAGASARSSRASRVPPAAAATAALRTTASRTSAAVKSRRIDSLPWSRCCWPRRRRPRRPPAACTDDTGETVTVTAEGCRIVSLAPGTTAMLYAAGAGHCLVGTIAHSKEPAEAAAVPIVGDAETLDFEQLLALRPTVVVVAVDVVQRVRIDRIRALGIPVYQVHVTRLAQMPESLRRLGDAGRHRGARAAARRWRCAPSSMRSTGVTGAARRCACSTRSGIGLSTRSAARHVISDALQVCGASNIFAELETAAPAVTREAAMLRDPELIVVSAPPPAAPDWIAEWRRFPALTRRA